ncbi:MAG: class I SAM-dependent methyltransferase [Chloroflexi bacterium]|nr:class I SAM-dependent methyltransferase [Chloroflexota bacterium]
MEPDIIARLLDINYQFYQDFATPFSATRRRLQPGVLRAIELLPRQVALLDLGCGNGTLARRLSLLGRQGSYLGLDFSSTLLDEARQACSFLPQGSFRITFQEADLTGRDWASGVTTSGPFEAILAFAVLHHLPGIEIRQQFLSQVRSLLPVESIFILSVWQFLNSPRLAARCLPWDKASLSDADVDPGDYLLDWRREGPGLRYVHHFTAAELTEMARTAGFKVTQDFYSDGEGGNLGLYQVWKKV